MLYPVFAYKTFKDPQDKVTTNHREFALGLLFVHDIQMQMDK